MPQPPTVQSVMKCPEQIPRGTSVQVKDQRDKAKGQVQYWFILIHWGTDKISSLDFE